MRVLLVLLIGLNMGWAAWAQSSLGRERAHPSEVLFNLERFKLEQVRHVQIGGTPYTRIDYRLKSGIQVEPLLLAAQGIAIPAALYETFTWRTAKGVKRPSYFPADDKMKHLFAGFLIGDVTNLTLQLLIPENVPHRRLIAALSGFGMATVTGVVKELRDRQGYGTPDPKDALATAIGGAVGTLTMSFNVMKVLHPRSQSGKQKHATQAVHF